MELTEQQLEEAILALPGKIRAKEEEVAKLTEKRDGLELKVEVAKSISLIKSKADSRVTDAVARARAEVDSQNEQVEVIRAEGDLSLAEAQLNELEKKFSAAQSAIKIRTALITSQLGGH